MSMTIPSQKANRKEATEILLQLDEKRVEQFLLSRNDLIPVSIFSKKLSCFEALCKYLHENKQQSTIQTPPKDKTGQQP